MNICDSGLRVGPMSAAPRRLSSGDACGSSRRFARGLPSLDSLLCWALVVSVLLLMVSGCSRYKEEFENAKQQVDKLNSEVTRLTEEAARLNQDKIRLSNDLNALSDKNTRMQRELDDLNKAKATLSAENKEARQKNSAAEQEIASLKTEKIRMAREIEELKKRVAEMISPPKSPATPTEAGTRGAKQSEEPSPCDAVVAFMKASEGVVRQQKGEERTKSLEQIREQYAPKMNGAPEKAIKAAEEWVKEGSRFWDDSSADDAVLRLLQLRNSVLNSCGKTPREGGFN